MILVVVDQSTDIFSTNTSEANSAANQRLVKRPTSN